MSPRIVRGSEWVCRNFSGLSHGFLKHAVLE